MNRSLRIGILISAAAILSAGCSLLTSYEGQLVFESKRTGNSDIFIVDVDGENLQNLTNNDAYDGTPAFSPDGAFIAFTSDRSQNAEVYVMGLDGSDPQVITSGQGYSVVPTFSPDSSKILFSSNRSYRIPVEGGEIDVPDTTKLWTIDFGSRQVERLTTNIGLDMYGSYSPDGEQIVFMTVRDGNPEIYLLTADGRELNLTENPGLDMVPDWSPEGSKIIFMSDRDDGNKEIYLLDLEGDGELVNLTDHPANDSDPVWSPDGSLIAFTSDRDGNIEIYVMRADGTGVRRVTNHPADDIHPQWNPTK